MKEILKNNHFLKKYTKKLDKGDQLEPEFVAKRLSKKIGQKGNYSDDTEGLKEILSENHKSSKTNSPKKDSKKFTTKNSPVKHKNESVTLIIQDI